MQCRFFVEHTRHLFVDVVQGNAIATGQRPAKRAVFRKTHGVASGVMVLDPNRSIKYREGIFAGDRYPLWMRFSSDVAPDEKDATNGTIGVALKLFGITPPTLASVDPEAPTADLILQNHDVFFVDTGQEMCVFTDWSLNRRGKEWLELHPKTDQILKDMKKYEESLLTATYWSVLPYACGSGRAVKYRLLPLQAKKSEAPDKSDKSDKPDDQVQPDPNRLSSGLATSLAVGSASFAFQVQEAIPGSDFPIDLATVRWDENVAPFETIARIDIDRQDIRREGQQAYGDTLAFSSWRVPEANRPLGSIAESRRVAYPASAASRHLVNGIPDAEPHLPREG